MSDDDAQPRSLQHPLPAGMRDLLPGEAARRRRLSRAILARLELWGYTLVTPPAFEFADVLERGLGTLDPAEVLRFVEPESGEVAALRPDMTPQIARMIATRLRDRPPPLRLAYEGTVLRRRGGRAKTQRQIPQVGVELAGLPGQEGDVELLAVAADALRATGLERFTMDLGDAGIVRALLADAPADRARHLSEALARKDETALEQLGAPTEQVAVLRRLARLHGDRDSLLEGMRLLDGTPARPSVERLLALYDAACARGLGPHLRVDLGEVRNFAYYTGPIYELYAPGPGEAIGAGGRYDELLARFGMPMAAVGFALNLEPLEAALRAAGHREPASVRVVLVGGPDDARLAAFRGRGIAAVALASRGAALAYARAWGFTHVVDGDAVVDLTPSGTNLPLLP
jgi:ATP phosphoribosyltransferase regulatory subunit